VAEEGPSRLKIGVVGAGRWGQNLIRAFSTLTDAQVSAICDPVRPRDAVLGRATFYASFDAFLQGAPVDAVVLATPAELHSAQAIAALERGLHVFVEKPMALQVADAIKMRDAARAARKTLMVGHLLRYHPAILRLKQWLSADRLGTLEGVLALRLGPGTRDAAANPWWSLAPHDLSLLRYFAGSDPQEISARECTLGGEPIVHARLRVTGMRADIHVGAAHGAKVRRFAVFGSHGAACFDDGPSGPVLLLHEGALPCARRSTFEFASARSWEGDPSWTATRLPPVEPLAAEVAHFVAAISGGGRVATDAEEGCRVTAVLEAGAQSLFHGGAPVEVRGNPGPEARLLPVGVMA
jgi:UDP-2-acetamido-3-amino-2,3-dideoxy-glucuronate N-acetyltransferase